MTKIVISGHGKFSLGMLSACEMIFGKTEDISAIPFIQGDTIDDLKSKYKEAMNDDDEEYLFLIDLFSGTPYNAIAQLIMDKDNVDMVTGTNLPLVLEAVSKSNEKLDSIVKDLRDCSKDSIKIFSEEKNKTDIEETDEDISL
ncbi:PTS sugar transporter subunit IIA [Companilactobacillus halodurans]|uniref:PTS sugar transporter subunit IIA n=1 Tax=Companilactobacillus halodurans TaxID=2584183 RepID=A0A5P0ZRS3_9LACO|nr:PTS sugar transporter subunit IIA [Companilactobacillus halodurans]MQS76916.1 PTS sugar transporter subunit IIA [Companilactobacillus halodurans]MQS98375.1 PTS sugar transporter subunit IIA [Companilactobacillus halodurans]